MSEGPERLRSFGNGSRSRLSAFGAGYTWFVRITKIALPLGALIIIGVVVTRMSSTPQALQLADIPKQEKTKPGQSALEQARYEGTDSQGRKYTLTADRAIRDMTSLQAVALEKPKGEIALENNGWLKLEANRGRYDNGTGKLNLSEGVRLEHSSGYTITLQDADVDVKTRHVMTNKTVQVTGPIGDIDAATLEVTDGGDLIIFGGPAKALIKNLHASIKVPG